MSSGPRQNLPAICRYRRTDAPGPIYRTREFQRVLEPAKSLYQDESGNQEAKKRLIRLRSSSWIAGFQICSSVLERESRDGARFCASLFPAIAFRAEFGPGRSAGRMRQRNQIKALSGAMRAK